MMIITIMKRRSFTTLPGTHWHLFFMNLTMKNFTMKNLSIMNLTILRKNFLTLPSTLWHRFTIKGLTMRNLTMGMSCMTHLTIHWRHRNISSISNMRSTESQQHGEALTLTMNLTVKNSTIEGGFQHPEDLSQGIGTVRVTCWALSHLPLLD